MTEFKYRLSANLDNTNFVDIRMNYPDSRKKPLMVKIPNVPKSNCPSSNDLQDSFAIYTHNGFDLPLQVSSNKGGPLICSDPLVSIYNIIGRNFKF